jgi:outer membrane protein
MGQHPVGEPRRPYTSSYLQGGMPVKRSFSSKSRMGWIALAAMMVTVPAWAEIKIGFVDVNKLLSESPQAKAASDTLRTEFTPRQRDIQSEQQSLKAREDKLNKDAATMTEDQRSRAERDLQTSQRDLQRKMAEFQDDINARRNEEMSHLQRTLFEEVKTYAKSQNYDLIVTEAAAIYSAPALDITSAVLAALQAHGAAGAAPKAGGAATPKPAAPSGH